MMHAVEVESYPLAPMSPGIRWMTVALFALPAGFLWFGTRGGGTPVLGVGAFVALLYLLVWLWFRPRRFELSAEALRIVWPLRRKTIPLARVTGSEEIGGTDFRERYGWGMRVGAGGLWGGFGLLVTRRGTLRFYISRLDCFALIHVEDDRPLLITPERPGELVRGIEELRRGRSAASPPFRPS